MEARRTLLCGEKQQQKKKRKTTLGTTVYDFQNSAGGAPVTWFYFARDQNQIPAVKTAWTVALFISPLAISAGIRSQAKGTDSRVAFNSLRRPINEDPK